MSLPTLEQYQRGGTTWRYEHRGVSYTLSHHGVSEYQPEGTWCYYLHLLENMFQNPEDFALFDKDREVKEMLGTGSHYETHDYYSIPDLEFHGGATWYSKDTFLDRKSGKDFTALKIGCDYGHSWDRDGGYWEGMQEVERDAKRSIDILVDRFPMNARCEYCGIVAHPSEFYIAGNGRRVHISQADKFEDGWAAWRPRERIEAFGRDRNGLDAKHESRAEGLAHPQSESSHEV